MAEGEDIGLDDLATGAEVAQVVRRIARVARDLARRISRGPLEGHGATRGENSDGDTQKALFDAVFARRAVVTSGSRTIA